MRKSILAVHKPFFWGWIPLLLAALAATPAPATADCSGAAALSLDETRRDSGSDLLEVTVSTAGVLTLDVSSPAAGVQPKIVFLGTSSDCLAPAGEGSDFDDVGSSPEWVVLDVFSDTTYYLEVEPQDSQQTLGAYKLRVAWVPAATTPDENNAISPDATETCSSSSTDLSSNPFSGDTLVTITDSTDEWDDDIMKGHATVPGVLVVENYDPQGPDLQAALYSSTSCGTPSLIGTATLSGSSGRIAALAYPGDYALALSSNESTSTSYEVAVQLFAPCDQGESDDHGDTALCATAIAVDGTDEGELANSDDDDEDYFSFTLSSPASVEITTTGSTDTYGSLYDEGGLRLEHDDGGGGNFRIARTLLAGRYFVRVEGAGAAEGSYALKVSQLP